MSVQRVITELEIADMRSVHAVRAIYTALVGVEGITHADVRLGTASITHDGRATCDILRAAVKVAGYEVSECRESRRRLT